MVSSEDWAAAMDSEVFRGYMRNELEKQAANAKASVEKFEADLDAELIAMRDLEEFEKKVKASPKLLATFRKLQEEFLTNEDIVKQADPKFVSGVLMLNLEDNNDI